MANGNFRLCATAQLRQSLLLITCVALVACIRPVCAQESSQIARDEAPLIDQQPFDLITLTPAAGGDSVKVFPLAFPNRRVPSNTQPSDKLDVVLQDFPERKYEIAWRDIEKVDLFEQRIYDEAQNRLAQKDFIGAFQNLSYLLKNYSKMPRLEELRQEFLFRSAADRFQAGEYQQTLSALEELRTTAPSFQAATVLRVLSQVADSLLDSYRQAGDLGSAKAMLSRLEKTYGEALPVIKTWKNRLLALATAKRDEAVALLEEKRYLEARRAASDMLSILPDVEGGAELLNRISAEHPMVRVGVMQKANCLDPTSLIDWAARRAGALVNRPLFQFVETGGEGGRYGFALGTFRASDDRQQLILSIDPNLGLPVDAFSLSQQTLQRADPDSASYDPSWAAIFQSVSIKSSTQVVVQLKRPNVLPHALMQWILGDVQPCKASSDSSTLNISPTNNLSPANSLASVFELQSTAESADPTVSEDAVTGPYRFGQKLEREQSFVLRDSREPLGQPVEIVEIFYDDPKLAVNDLLRGEIDVLDQLYPADARRLAGDLRIKIGAYALPTNHMLVPVSEHRYLQNMKFRRALLYATDRERTLTGELLGSENFGDGRLVSGPFPLGSGNADPLAYAYNKDIEPMEYNPQLAKLLVSMTGQELRESAKRMARPEPKLEKLIVGCPDFEFARVAVQAMIQQWMNVGIEAEMVVLNNQKECPIQVDLLYVTATMWEPATDIERLLGGNGLATTDNPFIVQGLERLRSSRNWREVRTALQDLHQLIDYHLPVLPLWQVVDRFAYNRYVDGLENRPVSLYQDIAAWRINLGRESTASR